MRGDCHGQEVNDKLMCCSLKSNTMAARCCLQLTMVTKSLRSSDRHSPNVLRFARGCVSIRQQLRLDRQPVYKWLAGIASIASLLDAHSGTCGPDGHGLARTSRTLGAGKN